MELLTFANEYETIGSKGTVKVFHLKDQCCGKGPYSVVVPCMNECYSTGEYIFVDMYKVFLDECDDEFFLVPDDVALKGFDIIPERQKSLKRWYQDMFWFYPVGDMKKINLELYGIHIHGRLEHNGEQIYEAIQSISPTKRTPKFNASNDEYSLESIGIKDDKDVYIVKR